MLRLNAACRACATTLKSRPNRSRAREQATIQAARFANLQFIGIVTMAALGGRSLTVPSTPLGIDVARITLPAPKQVQIEWPSGPIDEMRVPPPCIQ